MKEKSLGFGTKAEIVSTDKERPCPILQADSGRSLTVEDLNHHMIVFGSTGAGKSTNCILPCTYELMRNGHCGVTLAVKMGLTDQIRILAQASGRLEDLIEMGTTPNAMPVNILQGMNGNELYQFFDTLVYESMRGMSHNYDFHAKGVRLVTDCALLLGYLNRVNPNIVPNILTITEMINDYHSATRLWLYYKNHVFDPASKEEIRFVHAVESNPYHILQEPVDQSIKRHVSENSRGEQITYATGSVRSALRTFLDVPGIIEKFCDPKAPGVDMAPILNDNKLAVIQINPEYGPIATSISRFLLKRIYQATIKHGKTLPEGRKMFVCIDEFQEVADLSAQQYSDSNFIAMAREYNGIFLAATQSLSALMGKGETYNAVDSFVSNCNSRCMFYTDDPVTQSMAARYNPDLPLIDLKPGEALMVAYNNDTREHTWGLETFQNAYESIQKTLESPPPSGKPAEAQSIPQPTLVEMAAWAMEDGKSRPARVHQKPVIQPTPQRVLGARNEVHRRIEVTTAKIANPVARSVPSCQRHKLVQSFPDYFAKGDVRIELPAGWMGMVEKILRAFAKTGLKTRLTGLYIRNGRLVAKDGDPTTVGAIMALNALLRLTENACMLCGGQVEADMGASGEYFPLCRACLEANELPAPIPSTEKEIPF